MFVLQPLGTWLSLRQQRAASSGLPSSATPFVLPNEVSMLSSCLQVWLATGTDLGGSLRNPASYCGIVGMRNTVGLIPEGRPNPGQLQDKTLPFWRLQNVHGLMARSAGDLALGLDAVVGQHYGDPL